jgi:hypothetical protein
VKDAANILGVSRKTIERDLKVIRADVKDVEDKVAAYQRRFKERLPIDERVRLYEEIARQDGNLFARFKALQRVDAIDGIVTDGERLRIPRDREPSQPAPMFIFAGGCNIDFGHGPARQAGEVDTARNITPEPPPDTSERD